MIKTAVGRGSISALRFQEKPPGNAADLLRNDPEPTAAYHHLLERSIAYMSASISHCWLCEPHTRRDVEEYLAATEELSRGYR